MPHLLQVYSLNNPKGRGLFRDTQNPGTNSDSSTSTKALEAHSHPWSSFLLKGTSRSIAQAYNISLSEPRSDSHVNHFPDIPKKSSISQWNTYCSGTDTAEVMLQVGTAQTPEDCGAWCRTASPVSRNERYNEGEIMHSHFQMSHK